MIDRRRFLTSLGALSVAACAGTPPPRLGIGEAELSIDTRVTGRALRADMIGLSFESERLADARYFTPDNAVLVRLFRNLGAGTLRLGGSSSEAGLWQRQQQAVAAPYRYAIGPGDIDRLRNFLDATGWRLVYGLDLAHGDADRAADEAAYVASRVGDRLDAIQVGNEPDLYERDGLRSSYGVDAFIAEWKRYVAAIRARAGDVPLAGPDIAYKPEWLSAFARTCGGEVRFLSDHYYPVGPAKDPSVDIGVLWRSELTRYPRLRDAVQTASAAGKPLRITEGNSCWDGGKTGVSDTMASALWAVSMLQAFFRDGGDGFCFHGGPDAVYTPIAGGAGVKPYQPRPLYYGLLLLARMLPGMLIDARLDSRFDIAMPALRTFATRDADGRVGVVIANILQAGAIDVRVRADRPLLRGAALRLSAPTLFNRDGVTFGGAEVAANGQWTPRPETVAIDHGDAFITIASASAVHLRLDL